VGGSRGENTQDSGRDRGPRARACRSANPTHHSSDLLAFIPLCCRCMGHVNEYHGMTELIETRAEQVGSAVKVRTRVREVFGSILGWDTDYHEAPRGFPQSLQAIARIVPQLGHNRSFQILSNSSFINNSTIRHHIF
jgi:hypothetical protein